MIARLRDRLRRDDGFSIVEALVAAFILTLGSLAVFMTFVAAIHNVQRSKETQFGISVAQREMEWVRSHPFSEIALVSAPPTATGATNAESPLLRVLPGGTEFSVNRSETVKNTTSFKQEMSFVDDVPGGFAASKEVKFVEGTSKDKQVQATVYRFVLCEEKGVLAQNCGAKRVVIDVVPKLQSNEHSYQRNYYELQSTILNPTVTG